jgi:hypothetical protein
MVCVIIVYLHSGRQWLWLEEGAPGPACWRQAGLDVPFLLGWPVGKRILKSEETDGRIPSGIAHGARHLKCWLTPNSSPGTGYIQGDYPCSFVHTTVMFARCTRVEHYQRKDQ